ncbi:MAG: hypothetical protein RSF37_14630 [Clostridium sp.]|uniref:hypothetical protein n=1 Tax=Clostridium sp. TaxID=1506 RepID=UPI002FC7DC62
MIVKLYEFLKSKGIDTFFIGQRQGECKSNYVVLKDDGIIGLNNKVGKGYIDLLFFIPQNQFTKCESFKKQVKGLVKEFGKIRYSGQETGIETDNDKKALTFSVLYEVQKKLEG